MIRAENRLSHHRRPALGALFARWIAIARQRRDLAQLDDAALRDVGIDARDARSEAARPFWDAPQNWRS